MCNAVKSAGTRRNAEAAELIGLREEVQRLILAQIFIEQEDAADPVQGLGVVRYPKLLRDRLRSDAVGGGEQIVRARVGFFGMVLVVVLIGGDRGQGRRTRRIIHPELIDGIQSRQALQTIKRS